MLRFSPRGASLIPPHYVRRSRLMELLMQGILALLLLTAAVYAHRKIPVFTKGRTGIMAARAILVLVGTGFGLLASAYVHGSVPQMLAFLIGLGMVHAPAAVVLFIKARRGEGRS